MTRALGGRFPYTLSGVGRSVDPAYPTNRAVLILIFAGFLGGTARVLLEGSGWMEAGLTGGNAAATVLLAWALTREFAPDDDPAAFGSVGLVALVWLGLGAQALLIPAVVLMAARLVNRSTGKAAEPTDALVVLGLFGYATWFVSWTLGIVGVAALGLDAMLPRAGAQAKRRYHLALTALVLALVGVRLVAGTAGIALPGRPILLGAVAVLALAAALVYPSPRSRGDVDGELLVDARVRSGLLLGILGTALVTLDAGVPTEELGVLWCSLAAVVVGLPFMLARRDARQEETG